MLFADDVGHVMIHSAQIRLRHGSSTSLCEYKGRVGTLDS